MNSERIRELLALRLYGELDPDQEAQLDTVLASSAEARELARELESVLGPLAARVAEGDDLPAGWRERLVERARGESAPRRTWSPWLNAVTGFAAGLLAMWMIGLYAGGPSRIEVPGVTAERATRFERAEEPPPATGRGPIARLSDYTDR